MPTIEATVARIAEAPDWSSRVGSIRPIPEEQGTDLHQSIYAAVAERLYVPHLAPDFAYVHWRPDYDLPDFRDRYEKTAELTAGFTRVEGDELIDLIQTYP